MKIKEKLEKGNWLYQCPTCKEWYLYQITAIKCEMNHKIKKV